MQCSNCGKKVPFAGNVCPYCDADKSGDQTKSVWSFIGAMAGGGVGYLVNHGAVALFVGAALGTVGGLVFASKLNNSE